MENEELLRRKIEINRKKIKADIILIAIILLLAAYIIYNIEEFKMLKSDVCRMCEEKTGGTCIQSSAP